MSAISRIISVAALLGLAGLFVSGGCGPSFNYEGVWKGQAPIPARSPDPSLDNTLKSVELRVVPGGLFKLSIGGMPRDGDMRIQPHRALLDTRSKMGRPMPPDELESFEIRPLDEDTLELEPLQQSGNAVIKLTRQPEPEKDTKRNP